MNSIHAAPYQTKFASEPHLSIWIDGVSLNDFLDRLVPDIGACELVPTWLDWMHDESEQEIVYARMKPQVGISSLVPILMCPDDADLACSVVIAEVSSTEDEVIWNQIGSDMTPSIDRFNVGSKVDWYDISELRFKRADYLECVRAFDSHNKQQSERDCRKTPT